ncbi:MAG: LysE family transporter [Bacteroidaceae bacterium]
MNIIELIIKGLFVGIVASAPMGPVGILCIRRTLQKGRAYGIVTGLGAAFSDLIYVLITGLGMTLVVDFIEDQRNMFYLQIVGSVMLLLFGIYMFFASPRKREHAISKNKGTLIHNFVSAFVITLSNPLIIFLFMALFAQFGIMSKNENTLLAQAIGCVSILLGAMVWWIALTYFVNKVRTAFNDHGIKILNRTIGSIVVIASIIGFILTIGHYSLN